MRSVTERVSALALNRSHVGSNVMMIQLQKQLADRSNAVTELEARFLQLQGVRRYLL